MTDYESVRRRSARFRTLYGTKKAADICRRLDIYLNRMHLGSSDDCIKGFITKSSRCYCITVNADLSEELQEIILLHELAHYELGHLQNTVCTFEDRYFDYFQSGDDRLGNRSFERARLENEANLFVAELLITDEAALEALKQFDFFRAAARLHVPVPFLEFKCRMLRRLGLLSAEAPAIASGDFLKRLQLSGPIGDDFC